jgi:hypothetical protein
MTKKQLFAVGLKLVGVYSMSLAIEVLFDFSSAEFIRTRNLAQTDDIFRIAQWFSFSAPIALSFVALNLISDGSYVQNFLFRAEVDEVMDVPTFFRVIIKLYGIYLVVSSIPDCLGTISNALTVMYAPGYLSTSAELNAIRSYGTSTLITLVLGFWCGLKEKSLVQLALRQQ